MANHVSRMLFLMGMMLIGLLAGCRSFNKGITESILEGQQAKQWRVHYGSRLQYVLTNKSLEDVEFEGTRNAGNTTVRYPRGLAEQAQCIADRTAALLDQVQERTGITISTRTAIYLLRFDQRPQDLDITLAVEPNEFPLPLFVQVGDESCEAILAQNRSYPYLLVHELVETSLVNRAGGQVLPDLFWGAMGLNVVHVNNYTRWFRDGLANYAGYVAYEIAAQQTPSEQRLSYPETVLHTDPFSALKQIGDKLFSWPQSSNTEREREYYSAALGLFLLIADEYGEQAIRDIVGAIARKGTVDGRDLIEITNRRIQTNVKKLAADFEFPRFGLEVERMTPAWALDKGIEPHEGLFIQAVKKDSTAEKAGLKRKDVIIAVGPVPVTNLLDFQVGVFKARKQPSVPLTILRQGAGTLTLELPLREPGTPKPAPGKRQNPLRKGKIEISSLF